MNARDAQVGGDHYKKREIQPWDVIDAYGMGFYQGNALKYLLRYKDKGGVEDLKKARHYLDKLIEVETRQQDPGDPASAFRATPQDPWGVADAIRQSAPSGKIPPIDMNGRI